MGFIEEKDSGTKNHCRRVAYYSRLLADSLNLEDDVKERIYRAGLIHDIGKIGIPDEILTKKGKLTNEEFEMIKQHSKIAYDLLPDHFCVDLKNIILAHHERYDGKGYPNGNKGSEMPLESRILAVADSFDAMTTKRSYNEMKTSMEALQELKKNRGTQFDSIIVDAFEDMLLFSHMNHVYDSLKVETGLSKLM